MDPEENIDQRKQEKKKPKNSKPKTLSEHNEKKPILKKLRCEVSI